MKKLLKDYTLTELMQEAVRKFELNDSYVIGSFNGACGNPIPFNYRFSNGRGDIDLYIAGTNLLCVETPKNARTIRMDSRDIGDFFTVYNDAFEETSAKAV